MREGLDLAEGFVFKDGLDLAEGFVFNDGLRSALPGPALTDGASPIRTPELAAPASNA